MMKRISKEGGFTLIELLIVIVIIGILAAVVLAALNPLQQQRRAQDATRKSTLSKLALSGKSLQVSAPRNSNRAPTHAEFAAGVGSIAANDCTNDVDNSTGQCLFNIDGITLAPNCGTNAYSGTGTDACRWVYYRAAGAGGGEFRVGVRGSAIPEEFFVFAYRENADGTITEGFYGCPVGTAITADPSTTAGCVEYTN